MDIHFVKTPFSNNPSMNIYNGEIFYQPPNEDYITEKKRQLNLYDNDLYGETLEFQEKKLINEIFEKFNLKPKENLRDLSLLFQEDIAVMHQGKLQAISFCFPSGWIPSKALGEDFAFLHTPVADNEVLIKSSKKLTDYMCKHTIQRWVWNVTTIKELTNHPKTIRPTFNTIDELFFRVETQTSTPINSDTSIFFVNVEVVPLKKVWSSKILESVNSMSQNVLDYKNLNEIKKYLNSLKSY